MILILMIILVILLCIELIGYIYHIKVLNFAKHKRYFDTDVDSKWIENFILKELSPEELTVWISNSISYNCSEEDHKYYNEVPLKQVPKNKMIKWTCYYLFFKSMWQLTEEQISHGRSVLQQIEQKIRIQFPDTFDPNVYFLKFGGNRLECKYRPLTVYFILSLVKHVTYINLRMSGFECLTTERSGMTYMYYKNPDPLNTKTVMFIHGLGLGITPYLSYLKELTELGSVIAPILPNLSNMEHHGIFSKLDKDSFFPSYETIRYDFKMMLEYHDIDKVDIVSHSFGTIVLGILMKDSELASKIDKKVFVDPVCFIDRSFKILRYINEPGDTQDGVVNSVFNLLVYNDIYVRYIAQRFLYGPEFWILDYEKLNNNKSLLVLSHKDSMVPSESIHNRCKKHGVQSFIVNDANHADIFLVDEFRGVWNMIKSFIDFKI